MLLGISSCGSDPAGTKEQGICCSYAVRACSRRRRDSRGWRLEKFYVVSPAVPNGAGDHRAARTPPWRGAVRWSPPTCHPPTHNGLYGRVLLCMDTLPPPSRHLEPPFSVGEVGRLNPYHGEDLPLRFTARPRMGGRRAAGRIFG